MMTILALLAACALSACAPAEPARAPAAWVSQDDPSPTARPDVARGKATYYADSLAGNRTASGEIYNPRALTAAHRSHPFGTLIEVERKDGRRVVVRVNDRGPFGRKRVIVDLSRAAAEQLGMIRDGTTEVTVRVLKRPRHGSSQTR